MPLKCKSCITASRQTMGRDVKSKKKTTTADLFICEQIAMRRLPGGGGASVRFSYASPRVASPDVSRRRPHEVPAQADVWPT